MAKKPAPNGPPHGGIDFAKSQPDPDPPRATYVLARRLMPGDRIMVRCTQPTTGLTFDEDRTVKRVWRQSGRQHIELEPKADSQNGFDVALDHRFVAVKVTHPIKIKRR